MASIQSTLNTVWSTLERARILGDPRIIDGIAALLGKEFSQPGWLASQLPEIPSALPLTEQQNIVQQLRVAAQDAKIDLAELFDRYILFRLHEMQPGSRYPTPRHLVAFMYRLAEVQSSMLLADLACGSAGFLVHHMRQPHFSGTCTGIEVDAEWAGLAATNLILHHALRVKHTSPPMFFKDDTLSPQPHYALPLVDRVLMNPPFEEPLQTRLLQSMLESLDANGRACALVPAGTLFNTTIDTVRLRQRMVGAPDDKAAATPAEFQLQAVIELPKNACQPFSGITTYVLLVQRGAPAQPITWFLRGESDGYTGAKKRDLSRSPGTPNDLPTIEQLVTGWSTRQAAAESTTELEITPIESTQHDLLGFSFTTRNPDHMLVSARRYSINNQLYLELLIGQQPDSATGTTSTPITQWLVVNATAAQPVAAPNLTESRGRRVFLTERDPSVRSVALHRDGRLLGVGIDTQQLHTSPYDLRVDRFVRDREEAVTGDPTTITGTLYDREQRLLGVLDELRDLLSDRRARPQTWPPSLTPEDLSNLQPFGRLSQEQQEIWSRIIGFVDDSSTPMIATYFNLADVLATVPNAKLTFVETTLGLFEQMGLIVPVRIRDQSNQEFAAYRLCCSYDYWDLSDEAASDGIESTTVANESPSTDGR
ncbi:MAG TPA: N-6 DNA methylase [Herpetosiphonaceae bacterium]